MKLDRRTLAATLVLISLTSATAFGAPPPKICKKHPWIRPCVVQTLLSAVTPSKPPKK